MNRPQENHLLSSLCQTDLQALLPYLEAVDLPLRYPLEIPHKPVCHAYFLTSGIGSVVGGSGDHDMEAGIVGRDGMTGTAIVLIASQGPNKTCMQIAGRGLRIMAAQLFGEMEKRPTIRHCLLRYAFAFHVQITQTLVANSRAKLDARLARWLLMAHDRLDGDTITLTHEFLSRMLGVRRAGITTTVRCLQDQGCVRAHSGFITIIDRAPLERIAAPYYGIPEREQLRLTGWESRNSGELIHKLHETTSLKSTIADISS